MHATALNVLQLRSRRLKRCRLLICISLALMIGISVAPMLLIAQPPMLPAAEAATTKGARWVIV